MIRIFYGDDRVRVQSEVGRVLSVGYEVVEGENLHISDMASLFFGASLFDEKRRILVKDLGENTECFEELPKYLESSHEVVVWESKLDKRTTTYKDLVKAKVEMREFKLAEAPEKKMVFDVLDEAWRGNGRRAVELVEKIEVTNDPYMFVGLMVSQMVRKLESGDRKAKRAIEMLAECDLQMKSTGMEPWVLVKAMLVRLANI